MDAPKIGVAGILLRSDGAVLLGQRGSDPHRGAWAFPGGKMRFREPLDIALVREFYEETGLIVRADHILYGFDFIDTQSHYVILDWAVQYDSGQLKVGSDLDAVAWVLPGDLRKYRLAPGMKECLADSRVREFLQWPHH